MLTLVRIWPALIALVFGVLSVLGFAPFNFYFVPILTLAGLFTLWLQTPSKRHAALIGFMFGLGFFGAGVNWVYISLHDFGGMSMPLAATATFLFCAFLALFPALVGVLQLLFTTKIDYARILPMAALWVLMEWVRGWILTGFPWLAVGYSQAPDSPLAGYAPLVGVYGVSLFAAFSAGIIALGLVAGRTKVYFALLLIWVTGFGLKQIDWTNPLGPPLSVSLVQGNIAQDRKWRPEMLASTLQSYGDFIFKSKSKLIILPETAFPIFRDEIPTLYLNKLESHVQGLGADVISGIPDAIDRKDSVEYYNGAFNFGSAPTQIYRKYHLVPFGEYLPLRPVFAWVLNYLHIPLSDFSRGAQHQRPMAVAGQKIAVNICYEDVFGEEIIRQLPEASMLVNLTNDAWFGHSIGPQQHLQISQMRALETGRYMLRSTNTGVTAIINEKGFVVARAPEYVAMSLDGYAQGYGGSTAFIIWGNYAALLMIGGVLVGSAVRRFYAYGN